MDPTTLRLQETTLDELDEEAEEFGFDDRASYLRYIIENRAVVMEENAPEQVTPLRDRLDDLEQRLRAVEDGETTETTATENTGTADEESLLAFEETTGETTEATEDTTTADTETTDLLPENYPGRNVENRDQKREAGVAAIVWLSSREFPANKGEFVDQFYDDYATDTQNKDTFWKKVVRPALQESPVVEYSHGNHEYSATVE